MVSQKLVAAGWRKVIERLIESSSWSWKLNYPYTADLLYDHIIGKSNFFTKHNSRFGSFEGITFAHPSPLRIFTLVAVFFVDSQYLTINFDIRTSMRNH